MMCHVGRNKALRYNKDTSIKAIKAYFRGDKYESISSDG